MLESIGYPPEINLSTKEETAKNTNRNSLTIRMGVAGFCFGNIMLLAFPEYLGFTGEFTRELKFVFSYLSLLLALPVVFYCSSDYYYSA